MNLGYGFINFVHPLYIISFFEQFNRTKWNKYYSEKTVEMKYADKQNNANYHLSKNDNTYFHNTNYKPYLEVIMNSKYIKWFSKNVNEYDFEKKKSSKYLDSFFVVKIRNNKYY